MSIGFIVFTLLAIVGAMGMITSRNPVYSVLYMILSLFSLAGLFLTLQAQFLFIIQIIVYAGAIMILFLFVIMLLNLTRKDTVAIRFNASSVFAVVFAAVFFTQLLTAVSVFSKTSLDQNENYLYSTVESIGHALLTEYVLPFELISLILLVAIVAAIVIAKKYRGI